MRGTSKTTRAVALFGLGVTLLPLGVLAWGLAARVLGGAAPDPVAFLSPRLLSPRLLGLLGNSVALALVTAALATVFGLSLATWLHVSRAPAARVIRRTYLLPFFLPNFVLALAWMSVAGRRQLLDSLLDSLLGPDRVAVSAYGFVPTALVLAMAFAPIVTLIVGDLLAAVDAELLEEALVLDAPFVAIGRIVLPLIAPGAVGAAGIAFALALVEYTVPSSLQQNVYVMEVYAQFSQDADVARAALLALPLVLLAALALVAAQSSLGSAALRGRARSVAGLTTAGWPDWAVAALRGAATVSVVATFGPLAILALRLGSPAGAVGTALAAGRETLLTVAVAGSVAVLAALLAGPAARIAAAAGGRIWWIAWALPLALPAPLVGVALAASSTTSLLDWAQGLPVTLVLAHLARILPFAVIAAAAQVRRVDPLLREAAALHDLGRWRRIWRVELPLLVPALATAWLVAFVLSLGELGATLLVVPPGQATLPLRVYNLMHYGATDAVAALALVVAGAAGIAALLVGGLRKAVWPWAA